MAKTSRRSLLKVAAAGSVSAALGLTVKPETEAQSNGHNHTGISGPLALATVSFGQWTTDPALDRLPVANPGARNTHLLIPNEVKIQAGGTVNFIIAGFHQVVIYDNGTEPGDINKTLLLPSPLSAVINDPNHRSYRGLSPAGVPANFFAPGIPAAAIPAPPQERIESVVFAEPGTYLVICGVLGHFNDGMFGFVRVLP